MNSSYFSFTNFIYPNNKYILLNIIESTVFYTPKFAINNVKSISRLKWRESSALMETGSESTQKI